jgi:hypothetical protein
MQHGRPRLNLFARQLLVERVQAGWTPATAAEVRQRAGSFRWRANCVDGGAGV